MLFLPIYEKYGQRTKQARGKGKRVNISTRLILRRQKPLWYEKATYFACTKPVFVKCWGWDGYGDVHCGEEDEERRGGSRAIKYRAKSKVV